MKVSYTGKRTRKEFIMTEKIRDNIYRIGVRLPNNPLRELNSYLILGDDSDLLIDTGFRMDECRQDLMAGIEEAGSDIERLNVVVTHFHTDHSGLAQEIAGTNRSIYMSERDLNSIRNELNYTGVRDRNIRCKEEGFPDALVDEIDAKNPIILYRIKSIDERFMAVNDGDEISVGQYKLKIVTTPGHTAGSMMLWLESEKIMFTGDHVLFEITPNITFFSDVEDSLGDYLDSLRKVRNYPVELALPGHRRTGDYQARIDALLKHHEERLAEAAKLTEHYPGLTAYDIAGLMQWRIRARNWDEFPPVQKWFAVGECLAHLDHLRKQGIVKREMDGGSWRYYRVQEAGAEALLESFHCRMPEKNGRIK